MSDKIPRGHINESRVPHEGIKTLLLLLMYEHWQSTYYYKNER